MGLAAPKNRSKISADPNNNTWSRDTNRFGHKILTSQGWTPGEYLGAKDASHAAHYSAANASHIRVFLKDDNLGLGAKRGANAENFALSGFQALLGRLNGKSDEKLQQEADARRDVGLKLFQGRRFGTMQFISGGFLVGDKIEAKPDVENAVAAQKISVTESNASSAESSDNSSSKKRKRSETLASVPEGEEPRLKRKKKKTDLRTEVLVSNAEKEKSIDSEAPESVGDTDSASTESEKQKRKAEKKARKEAKRKAKEEKAILESLETTAVSSVATSSDEKEEKSQRRKEKQARKEEKRLKKEAKKRAKETEPVSTEIVVEKKVVTTPVEGTEKKTQTVSTTSTVNLTFQSGRQMVRQRYIRQKKLASMDPQALKEIFMVKTPA